MKSKESTISIIVPVYGTETYLERCLNSLLNQSYQHLEIIVVNDGSPGNVAEIMTKYKENPRILFVDNKENQGLLRARVIGSKYATGEYITFVDSDDYVSFDFYRALHVRAEETDSDITIGRTVWENGENRYVYNYHEAALSFDTIKEDQIRKVFFGQEYQCYSWHTIWNKIYKKELWDKCASEFESVDDHIIMTEDIFFSSLLFFNAKTVSRVDHDAYFYCVNENASTNSNKITIERYLKNMKDIRYVFSKVENYLMKNAASEEVMEGFRKGRRHYARMWKNLAVHEFQGAQYAKAIEAVDALDKVNGECAGQEYFFESVQTPWGSGFEFIKEQIRTCDQEYISFDIFDTLIKRPFYDPRDAFHLLDNTFSELTGNSISFSKIRIEAEDLARPYYGNKMAVEDITLDEIYEYMIQHYDIPRDLALKMKELECENELRFCTARKSGKTLLQLACDLGKHVVLISDMYLSRNLIEKILRKCGISGFERVFVSCEERCLKYNGRLFLSALKQLNISSHNMLHIGDTWRSDIEGSNLVGIKNIFLPKAIEIFENKIQGCVTNRCANIGRNTCGENVDYKKTSDNLGMRCMKAMVANYYFDNPYRTFHSDSDFNIDPYFMGYYLLGMHALGLSKWIEDNMNHAQYKHLVFLARDGYLPMNAYMAYAENKAWNVSYAQASRKALMPIMVKNKLNLYQLPIEYRAHSPETLAALLEFLGETNKTFWKEIEKAGLDRKRSFTDVNEYHSFIACYVKYCYDIDKHNKAKSLVSMYYQKLPDACVTFDMGYSGRIQAAICEAAGKKIDAFFVHEDYASSLKTKQFSNFEISDFYAYYPSISGLMREHIFSDPKGSCVGFEKVNGDVMPVFEEDRHTYPDRSVVEALQRGAIDFVKQFAEVFGDCEIVKSFSPFAVSIPFEGFLRSPSKVDMHIFSESYFEDMVFGASEKINIEQFAMNNLANVGWSPKTAKEIVDGNRDAENLEQIKQESSKILEMINTSSQIKRAIVWLVLDRKFFKKKMKLNYNRLFNKK